jgi:peptidyl-prolyl cis-trans isomerase A (cyclophilin A)
MVSKRLIERNFPVTVVLASLIAVVPLAAQTKPAAKKPPAAGPRGTQAATFDRALLQPGSLKEKAPETYEVKFTTTKGDFVIRVTRAWAPLGADRFYNLAKHRFYDEASFFRVLPRFVVQFGISAHPEVSGPWQSATIKDDPVKQSNRRGFVTFAAGGPNTRTTQVFINLGDNAALDAMGFSPFGEVTQGMDIVEKLYSGYGEGAPSGKGPRQDLIQSQGKAYLEKGFPLLDSIKSTSVVTPTASETPAKQPGAKP